MAGEKLILLAREKGTEDDVKRTVELVKQLPTSYWMSPASRTYHLARPAGLAIHSMNVMFELINLFDTPLISAIRMGMLHDMCKCGRYVLVNGEYELAPDYKYVHLRHGMASVEAIRDLFIRVPNNELEAIKWHMGLWDMLSPFGKINSQTHKACSDAMNRNPYVRMLQIADQKATFDEMFHDDTIYKEKGK